MRFGLIGYGALGRQIVEASKQGQTGSAQLGAILVKNREELSPADMAGLDCPVFDDLDQFLAVPMKVVAEAAGQRALAAYAPRILSSGVDFLALSYGAFADQNLLASCQQAAEAGGSRLLLCSGATGGLDLLQAVATDQVDEVVHVIRKPPRAWTGTDAERIVDLGAVTEPVCIYRGPAAAAVPRFPENVNIAGIVSLAGVGLDLTQVEIWVDPTINVNVQEIRFKGAIGEVYINVRGVPSANPKSGRLAAAAAVKALKNLASSVVIGV